MPVTRVDSQDVRDEAVTTADISASAVTPSRAALTASWGFTGGLSGSLQRTTDDLSYIVAGTNVTVTTGSNGQITISADGGGTLDSAYDGGGSGAGRRIEVDADPVSLEVTSSVGLALSGTVGANNQIGIHINNAFRTAISAPGIGALSERYGLRANASGSNSLAIGYQALAGVPNTGPSATVIGYLASGAASLATVVGASAVSLGASSVVVGAGAINSGSSTVLIGASALASSNAVVIGAGANNNGGTGGVVIGLNARSLATAVAIGMGAVASGTAIGSASFSLVRGTALGQAAVALVADTVAIGHNALASTTTCLAIGTFASSSGARSHVLGYSSSATSTDAALFGYQARGTGAQETGMGSGVSLTGTGASAFGYQASAVGTSTAIGNLASAGGTNAVALGNQASAGGGNSVAIGLAASTTNSNCIAIGPNATAGGGAGICVIGSTSTPMLTFIVGSGSQGTSDQEMAEATWRTTNASGTNITGQQLVIASGRGTGNAPGGSIVFQTSDAGASGTTLRSAVTRMVINGSGSVTFTAGITGSHTRVGDGTSFIVAGTNVTVTSASNGQITIAAATGSLAQLTLSGTVHPSGTSGNDIRLYSGRFIGQDNLILVDSGSRRQVLRPYRRGRAPLMFVPNNPGLGTLPAAASGGAATGATMNAPSGGTMTNPSITLPGTVLTSQRRCRGLSNAAPGINQSAGFFWTSEAGPTGAVVTMGTGTNAGGFDFEMEMGLDLSVANGHRLLMGVTSELAAQDPDDLDNVCGLARLDNQTDSNLIIIHKSGSATATTQSLDGTITNPMGGNFAAAPHVVGAIYRVGLWSAPRNANFIGLRVYRVDTDELCYENRLTSNIPSAGAGLYIICNRDTGTTSTQLASLFYGLHGEYGAPW